MKQLYSLVLAICMPCLGMGYADITETGKSGLGEADAKATLIVGAIGLTVVGAQYGYDKIQEHLADRNRPQTEQDPRYAENLPAEIVRLIRKLQGSANYTRMGLSGGSDGYLLVGPPGCGKTETARIIAQRSNAELFPANASQFVTPFQGSGNKSVVALYDSARAHVNRREGNKAIVFIDEIDALGSRANNSNYRELRLTINALLSELDGYNQARIRNIVTIAATNDPANVDDALKRPGRLGKIIELPTPGDPIKKNIILQHVGQREIFEFVNPVVRTDAFLDPFIQRTANFSCADIQGIITIAKEIAADEADLTHIDVTLGTNHFEQALQQMIAMKQRAQASFLNTQALAAANIPNAQPTQNIPQRAVVAINTNNQIVTAQQDNELSFNFNRAEVEELLDIGASCDNNQLQLIKESLTAAGQLARRDNANSIQAIHISRTIRQINTEEI